MQTFTLIDFNKRYPDNDACLKAVFTARYGGKVCPFCKKEAKFYKLTDRKCYLCSNCKEHIYPLADTIFHKSETPLKSWFYIIYFFATSRNGVSAMEIQRQLGVTYKTAWRMAKQIRTLFTDKGIKLSGTVEADETYIGGKTHGIVGRGAKGKTAILGMVQRKGAVKAKVVSDTTRYTVTPLIRSSVAVGSDLMTDNYGVYQRIGKEGYNHKVINHKVEKYVRGSVHTNTIEGFWSQLKRSIDGTYHAVSPKYLQTYVDEFAYRYNHRDATLLFHLLLGQVVTLSK